MYIKKRILSRNQQNYLTIVILTNLIIIRPLEDHEKTETTVSKNIDKIV